MRPGVALAGVQSLSATLDYPASHYILGTSASESDERPVARKLELRLANTVLGTCPHLKMCNCPLSQLLSGCACVCRPSCLVALVYIGPPV